MRLAKSVMGVTAATPKPTIGALFYGLVYFALPIVSLLLVIDVGLYLAFRHLLDRCYGITCVF